MVNGDQRDDPVDLEALLREGDDDEVPNDLPEKTIRKVHSLLTLRDLIELTTGVFILQFFAPILDLIAAALGQDRVDESGKSDERPGSS